MGPPRKDGIEKPLFEYEKRSVHVAAKAKKFHIFFLHIVTFKDLRKIIAEKNKEMEIESRFYDPNYYWKGKRIVPLEQWYQIKEGYGLKAALQYFPYDFRYGFPCIFDNIEDQTLKEEAGRWYSDFTNLMEYSKNTKYGQTLCFRCLLSPDREEAAIFIGINKIISRALDSDSTSIYPCRVLNRFACPYDKKIIEDTMEDGITKKPDVDYLFHLSEIAFAVELALARAQKEDSVFRIRSVKDVYHVLTDKETLEKVLQQGLKEEHKQHKDKIVKFFMNIKETIKREDFEVLLANAVTVTVFLFLF
jgi:hypothetical protein